MSPREEFLRLFLKNQPGIFAFILTLVRDRAVAEDILQDVALILWERFDGFDRSRSFGNWARGVASKKVLQHWQSDKRLKRLSEQTVAAVAASYDRDESSIGPEHEALHLCLENLPDKSRRLLALRY